ncbi:hypothetical protein NLG97_g4323 [Lecanicillium saksenae]|uniref:Uncharacterized protein n=1 Tax=Lecanicillium saksenae TaxID=468837 RepID=A0ACC1QYS4_9HYPO|nr:hypothetical protein NLG97_g4323 [Lecanicillium saksenae]
MKSTILLTAFTAAVSSMRAPPICLSNIIELEAGDSFVSASIDGSVTARCEASVSLDDPEFLPVTYTFDASNCDTSFIASFQVPSGLSAGDGYITWQCSGQSPTCNRIRVKGGQKDSSLALQRQGYVQCASKLTLTSTTRQSSRTPPAFFTGTGGLGFSWPTPGGTSPATSTSSADATSAGATYTGSGPTGTVSSTPSSTGPPSSIAISIGPVSGTAISTGPVSGTAISTGPVSSMSSNSQRSSSSTAVISDATTISARQSALTSTIFTTILLTQTITALATAC